MTGFQDVGVRAVVQGLAQYKKDIDTIDSKTKALGKAVVGALAGAAVGAAVGILGQKFAKLDQTMAGVGARAGLTAEQNDKLTDSVIRLSKANLQSQEEIALTGEALISLQGISADNQEQIERLSQSYLDYSQVTGQTAPDAVAAFDDILDAWNLTAEDGVGIMDALVVSHQKFGTDIVGAQSALNTYASTFQTLGLDVNDALGYINLFAASGIDAESSTAAFNKAVGLLTENSDASNKKLADMAKNLGFTNEQFEALKNADPAAQFDILTKAIAATEDPTVRAQAAIDLFGAKAGPKLGEALAGNNLEDFQISLEESAGASELAADKIQGTLTNKLKLLGNEITGRAMELTQQFMPALALLGNPAITSSIGGIAGALAGIKVPDLSGFLSSLGGMASAPFSFAGNATQTITQNVVRTGTSWISDFVDKVQNITQRITKVTIAPTAAPDVEKAGKVFGVKFTGAFQDALTGTFGTAIGGVAYQVMQRASFTGFMAGLARFIVIPLAVGIAASAIVALVGAAFYELFTGGMEIASGDITRGLSRILATIMTSVFLGPIGIVAGLFGAEFGGNFIGGAVASITAFFTPENIGRRLADLVAIALIGLFAVPVLLIHFRQPIADMFEMIGRLIVEGASALPGLLAGLGTKLFTAMGETLRKEFDVPLLGGLKVWELITAALFTLPATVFTAITKGWTTFRDFLIFQVVEFLEELPGLFVEGLQKTGDAIGEFFSTTLPDLLTRESFLKLRDAVMTFFGETLPNAITVEMPKIPGAILDALADLPGLVDDSLDLVTEKVTGWISGLGKSITDSFIPWDWIKTAASAFVDEIGKWLALIWGSGIITEWVTDLSNWLTTNFNPWTWVKVAVELLGTEVGKAVDGVVTTVTGMPQRILDGLGDLTWTLAQAGRDIIDGLWRGMQDVWEDVTGWLGGLAGKIVDLKGPPATDAQLLEENGRLIIGGLHNGMLTSWADIERFLQARGPAVWELFKPVVAKMQGAGLEAGKAFSDAFGSIVGSGVGTPITVGSGSGTPLGRAVGGGGMQGVAGVIGAALAGGMQGVASVVSREIEFTVGEAIKSGLERATRLAGGGMSLGGIDWMMGVSGKMQAQFEAIGQLVQKFNELPDAARKYLGETTGILDQFADAGVIVFEDFSARTQEVQTALNNVASGSATMHDALLLARVGFDELSQGIVQFNLGLITAAELAAMMTAGVTDIGTAGRYTLESYDLLAESLDKANDKSLELADAQLLARGGFEDLAAAIVNYNLGLITADELTQQIQTTFTEVATSAAVLGAQWTTAFADAMGRQDLVEAVGSAGVRVLDALNLVLEEGGQQNVETLAGLVTGLLTELESDLPAEEAAVLGETITDALQEAIEKGTPDAIQAVVDLLDGANEAMENGTTKILTSVDKFNILLGDKMADKALQEKVGRNGADLMDALDLAISTGGEKGVQTMANEAFAIVEAMGKELEPGVADYLGSTLMGALQVALETGGDGAVAAVMDVLAQINALIASAPTTIPAPKLEGTPSTPAKGASGSSDDGAHGSKPPTKSKQTRQDNINAIIKRLAGLDPGAGAERILGFFNAAYQSTHASAMKFAADVGYNAGVNWADFKDYLKTLGHVSFSRGGFVPPHTVVRATLHGGDYGEMITPASSPADLMASPGFASSAYARQGQMGTQIQVSPSVNFQMMTVDWSRVKQLVHDTVDSAIGQAKSQYQRSGVQITDGVG